MDADPGLVARDPRLIADHHIGEAGPPSPRGSRRRGGVLVASALVVLGVGAGLAAYRALASRGTLRIKTKPAGATVDLDGMTARTKYPDDARWYLDAKEVTWSLPLTLHRQPGTYDLTVTTSGYVPRAARVVMQPGREVALDIELQPITDMRLEIVTMPKGRTVWVDGHWLTAEPDHAELARTDLSVYALDAGRHDVKIDGDCHYLDWEQTVELHPGTITTIEAILERRPFRPSWCSEDEWRKNPQEEWRPK